MKTNYKLISQIALLMISIVMTGQNNPDFTLASNGLTCLCPDANFGDMGTKTINGESKTFTKRSRSQLNTIIANDVQDPQIALTCTSGITDMSELFSNTIVNDASSFNQSLEHWDVSNVTDMNFMFNGASSFNQPLNMWDVSQVTNMSRMFGSAPAFNQPLDNWDVSNVTDMSFMFISLQPASFDQNINIWDVSNVTNMAQMFPGQALNQPLDNWDVSQVTDMNAMFAFSQFNQPLNNWDVSNVTNMAIMFADNKNFNQTVDNWDVSNVTNMFGTFRNATSFDKDLSGLNFNQNVVFGNFLNNTNLSNFNYDLLLQSFDNQGLVDKNLEAIGLGYCDEPTRNNLINTKNWTFTGDVLGQCGATFNPSSTPFVTTWTVQQDDLDIEIYTINSFDYDFTVDWGDGQTEQNLNGDVTHTYANAGTYTVSITGVFPYFKTCRISAGLTFFGVDCDNSTKLSSVESWGNQEWRVMDGSFNSAENFNSNTLQAPDLSFVTSLIYTFKDAESFNQNIDGWDVSNVTDMISLFENATSFNQPLNSWNVSNVKSMERMFTDASSFNQPLSDWDVSNVTNMLWMFDNAVSFNQDISDWCVEQIPNEPFRFANNSPIQASFLPDWGATCTFSIAENSLNNFKVYPNPVEDQLNLFWSSLNFPGEMNIQVYNLSGKKVFDQSYSQKPSELDVSQLSSGIYLLKVISGDQSAIRKIVKK